MKKYIIIFIIIISLGVLKVYKINHPKLITVDLPQAKVSQEFTGQDIINNKLDLPVEEGIKEAKLNIEEADKAVVIDNKEKINNINLAVPFIVQAPTANWTQPFQDTCEEASLLMVDYYYQNKQLPNDKKLESLLSSMVIWQEDNWSGHFNLPVAKLAEYIKLFYNYRVEIIKDVSIEQLENFLKQGLPIIVPANGHKLANPFFSNDGPDYHMLVIKGYIDNNFITNDPGTKRGENFIYTYKNMMDSMADWDTKKSSATGPRNVLVLYNN